MHIPLLRTLVLAFLIAVLAACSDVSSVDAPAVEEAKATPISASEAAQPIWLEDAGRVHVGQEPVHPLFML